MKIENSTITPTAFYNVFIKKINDFVMNNDEEFYNKYKNNKEWTEFLNEKMHEVNLDFELESSTEYFRIDHIGYKYIEEFQKPKSANEYNLTEHCWNLEVAVEYENNSTSWMDEFIKLCHIKCGLKVLITYSKYNERLMDIDKLNFALEHLGKLNYAQLLDNGHYLVIFGNGKTPTPYADKRINFKPYVYESNKEKFVPLDGVINCIG